MNRRKFLASLIALPVGAVAAVKALPAEGALNLDEIFEMLYRVKRNRETLAFPWFQTTRLQHYASVDYLDSLDVAMGVPEPERRKNYHERRKERSRANLALARTQRPLLLP